MATIFAMITKLDGGSASGSITIEGTPDHVDAVKCDNMTIEQRILERIKRPRPMPNMYTPRPGSMLAAYCALSDFTDMHTVTVSGDIGNFPEYDPDVIY